MDSSLRPVLVIGAGFTGTALAVQLARAGQAVALFERSEPGPGVAYGTLDPLHLLNVTAKSMSVLPDQSEHFLDWLRSARRGAGVSLPRVGACLVRQHARCSGSRRRCPSFAPRRRWWPLTSRRRA
ncbi:FAD-dependent oxidoreductase [Sabulicella rubraurantiaca]|uniref:FAD-dependent oxidoreductase n=1 Tax=Sabulicella rubraurantiaca TaxID=2811429 RepID=UPI001A97CE1C